MEKLKAELKEKKRAKYLIAREGLEKIRA